MPSSTARSPHQSIRFTWPESCRTAVDATFLLSPWLAVSLYTFAYVFFFSNFYFFTHAIFSVPFLQYFFHFPTQLLLTIHHSRFLIYTASNLASSCKGNSVNCKKKKKNLREYNGESEKGRNIGNGANSVSRWERSRLLLVSLISSRCFHYFREIASLMQREKHTSLLANRPCLRMSTFESDHAECRAKILRRKNKGFFRVVEHW